MFKIEISFASLTWPEGSSKNNNKKPTYGLALRGYRGSAALAVIDGKRFNATSFSTVGQNNKQMTDWYDTGVGDLVN